MPDQEPKDTRLPVPARDRRPMARRSRAVSADRPGSLARALVGAPAVAASVVGAAAAAAMSGAAVASRLLWAWSGWRELPRSGAQEQQPSSWAGPGVHISYTHIEMHWPLDR